MRIPLPKWGRKSNNPSGIPYLLRTGGSDPYFLEQFKALRAKLEHRMETNDTRVLAVSSAVAGEGKTLLSVNLALSLASMGRKKVLLIDTDLRKTELATGLGIQPTPGLAEFLGDGVPYREIVRNSTMAGMYVIPAGNRVSNPADLLAGERFRTFLKEIRKHYDAVLLDTPPIVPVADTLSLRDKVDGFVLVYRAGFTPHTLFGKAVEEVGEKNIVGVVINGVEPNSQRYYQRYHGKYYRKPGEGGTTA